MTTTLTARLDDQDNMAESGASNESITLNTDSHPSRREEEVEEEVCERGGDSIPLETSTSQTPPDPNNNNNNRNSSSYNNNNNNNNNRDRNIYFWGCYCATAVLGVWLSALGIFLIFWEVLPAGTSINSSPSTIMKTEAMRYTVLAIGMGMILFTICIYLFNKCEVSGQTNSSANMEQGHHGDRQPGEPQQYSVPSYVKVVGNAQYPISQLSPWQNSIMHLPTYKEVMESMKHELNGSGPFAGKNEDDRLNSTHILLHRTNDPRLLPLGERSGQSSSSSHVTVFSIIPLGPPPQYEENLPDLQQQHTYHAATQ